MPTLIPQSQQRVMRWKNGGGVTCEIGRYPDHSTLETFDWRVSVATVQQGGAFSVFPGIDRSLAMLAGKGMALEIAGNIQQLTPADAALEFDGDVPVQATLLGGAVIDFNVMTRRTRYRHGLEHLALMQATTLALNSDTALLYVILGSCRVAPATVLQAGDAALFDASETTCLATPQGAAVEIMLVRLNLVAA